MATGPNVFIKGAALSALYLATSTAFGAGFQLYEQSASGLGNAFAGSVASAEDASTVFWNPAGMTYLKDSTFVGAAHIIIPSAKFINTGTAATGTTGAPIAGGNGDDGGKLAVVPNLYLTHALSDSISVGLGVSVPFGLATEYDDGWVGRYHGLTSDLRTININPSIAFKVSDQLSVGFGVSAMLGDLKEYSNAIACFVPALCGGLAASNVVATDGQVKLEGDDWGFGYNLGLIYAPDENTRVGLHYRSKVELTFKGDATYNLTNMPAAFQTVGLGLGAPGTILTDTFSAKLELPETATLGSYQKLNDNWSMMADVNWTKWSRFDRLVANFDQGTVLANLTQPENWRDTWRYAFGMTYHHNPKLDYRFGLAYDMSAVENTADRSPRIPDNNRWWLTFGTSYDYSDTLGFDLSYAYIRVDDGKTAFVDPSAGHTLTGNFDATVHILSGQLRWIF